MKNLTSEATRGETKCHNFQKNIRFKTTRGRVDVAKNRQYIQNNKNLEQTWFAGHMIHPALFLIVFIFSPSC